MTYSFDLFDTLVTRKVLRPKDIFILLEEKINQLAILNENIDFYTLRVNAEKKAREKSEYEEITIEEIYSEVNNDLKISPSDISKIIELEYEIEFENLIVIKPQLEKFCELENKIIITDTYFDRKFIERIIKDILGIREFKVYISSELKKTKKSGSLFDYVLNDLKISSKELTHIGDNITSDFLIPKKIGIKTEFYKESHLVSNENKINVKDIDVVQYFGYAKNLRINLRLENKTLKEVISSVIAPTLFLYVFDILQKASEQKLKKLYFLARDGQILLDIALIIQKNYFKDIECKYLYASRKAWHLASICNEVDDYAFEWLFYKPEKLTFYKIFDRLECTYEDYKNYFKENGIVKEKDQYLNYIEINKLKQLINNNKSLLAEIFNNSKTRRDLLIDYLMQEGFFINHNIGIVDVGWNGRLQYSLSKALRYENYDLEIHGFYFNLLKNLKYSKKDFLYKFIDSNISFSIPVFESFVYAIHGTLLGYNRTLNKTIKPVLKEKINTDLINWGLNEQQQVIKLFSEYIVASNIFIQNPKIKKQVLDNLDYFFAKPTKEVALLYSKIMHDDDPTASNLSSLVPKIKMIDYVKMRLIKKSKFEVIWWNASLVLYLPKLNDILNILRKIKKKLIK